MSLKYILAFYAVAIICVVYYYTHRQRKHDDYLQMSSEENSKYTSLILMTGLLSLAVACILTYRDMCSNETDACHASDIANGIYSNALKWKCTSN